MSVFTQIYNGIRFIMHKKCRIVERRYGNDPIKYVIQQKHFLFRWMWVDAWVNSMAGAACQDSFYTLKEAKANLCYFNGTKVIDRVMQ